MKNKIKWLAAFMLLSLLMIVSGALIGGMNLKNKEISPVSVEKTERKIDVIIDAGHGGEDGGCIGLDGTLEKDLNLSVATEICCILQASGVNAVLSRSDDTMLYDMYDDLSDYSNVKKTYDLRNRVRFAKESECTLFVSIHMNKFSDEKYSGLQVYYSANHSDSITAALRVQSYVKEYLQPENDREIKRAGSNIYILHRSQMPAVLVECGFLSNKEELEMLKDEKYQSKLSLSIAASIMDSISNFQS